MTIHKGNIEAYLLDYIEGNLDALVTAELMAFLSENPEYEKWIPEYDGHLCLEGGPLFGDKEILKKNLSDVPRISPENFEEFCIASAEGLLEPADQARLAEFIEMHPGSERDLEVYGKLFLQPDYLLGYPDKKGLKKREPAIIPLRFIYYAIGIAASIAILFLLLPGKPVDRSLSAELPEKSGTGPGQEIATPPQTRQPDVTSETISTVPVTRAIKKDPDTQNRDLKPDEGKPVIQPLASIEPIGIPALHPEASKPGIHKSKHLPAANAAAKTYSEPREAVVASTQTPAKILGSVVKKLNLWKAAEKAVTGFNYLTESRLSLVRTTDENGKFSSLSLGSEDYIIPENKVK